MKQGIICDRRRYAALNVTVLRWLRANVDRFSGDKWAEILVHPVTGDLCFRTTPKIEPALSASDIADIITLESDWFIDEL